MELQRAQEPGSFQNHDPSQITLPAVPQHDLTGHYAELKLPGVQAVLSPEFHSTPLPPDNHSNNNYPSAPSYNSHGSPNSVRSLPRIDPGSGQFDGVGRRSIEASMMSPSDTASIRSQDERGRRATSVVSMEDENVRIAAEALSGLGNPDFARSPVAQATYAPVYEQSIHPHHMQNTQIEPEPLLELFAQAHPWVGGTISGTINGSMYAYNTTKHYSPRIVQYSANLLERNFAAPMVNTVGTVGRVTGVEGGIRRYLDARRPGDLEHGESSHSKRTEADEDRMDTDEDNGLRRDSSETLPAYRASKPPSYREDYSPATSHRAKEDNRPGAQRSLSSQVFVMTSGLGVALSLTSRRSLQQCLGLLSQATQHVAIVADALKLVLEQYDQARESFHSKHDASMEKGERPKTPDNDDAARRLAEIIKKHSDDIWQTLKRVVNNISTSAGGALPANAKEFVRKQLLSLPQRWHMVSENQTGESETSRSAHRMVAFANEGLDMMSQVTQVVQATLESAEGWLERVGRRDEIDRDHYQQAAYAQQAKGYPPQQT